MASLSVFTPYVDKENASDLGTRKGFVKSSNGPLKAHVGKTFQSNIGQTPIRRALGSVNHRANITPLAGPQQQKPQQKALNKPTLRLHPPAPASKPPKQNSEKPKAVVKGVSPTAMSTVNVYVDEIEKMPQPAVTNHDEFSNIWPAAERPATYTKEFTEWRMWPFTQSETEFIDIDKEISDEDDVDPLGSVYEHQPEEEDLVAPAFADIALLTMKDLQLPSWEELEFELRDDDHL